uniref:Cadherin domain-containing protein n=1 Tax=Latimeria chalumnae TaxID=7897 RepID=H3A1L5_LATCH
QYFRLSITVSDGNGSCSGILNVIVLPVIHDTVNFTVGSQSVRIRENKGPLFPVTSVHAVSNTRIFYRIVDPVTAFRIDEKTGKITTTSNLDLDLHPNLRFNTLVISAYTENLQSSATAVVNITVEDVNDIAPWCRPAVIVKEVPETTAIGRILEHLSCTDPDFSNTSLHYRIQSNTNSIYKFRMQNNELQVRNQKSYSNTILLVSLCYMVNNTLTYDSAEMASVNFQYAASIVVTDTGIPQLTTTVSVFVTVTPVNKYPPVFHLPVVFFVEEDAPLGTDVANVNATDRDWKFNDLEFSIVGGNTNDPPTFYINQMNGHIILLTKLDFEERQSYTLTIQAKDLNNDILPDPKNQKTSWQNITIYVQDINDNPPVCHPPYYEETIYSTREKELPIVSLTCTDRDINSVLTYSIVGGNTNNRFFMDDNNLLSRDTFSYSFIGIYDPTTFELLVKVTDEPDPKLSTIVTVIVHVVPWTTTTSTKPTTHT